MPIALIPNYNNQEIIVYLIDYKSIGGNFYDSVIFDFRTFKDWTLFCREMQVEQGVNSLMIISNFQSTKRLRRGCYYNFRIAELMRLQPQWEPIHDSALFAYNFIPKDDIQILPVELFAGHKHLDYNETYAQITGLHEAEMPFKITDGQLRE